MFDRFKTIAFTDRLFRRMPGLYGNATGQIQTFEIASAAQRQEQQGRRIKTALRRARRLAGYSNAPASDRLEDWPILTKADIQGQENLFAERTCYPTPHAESGGTTGMPLRLKRSIASVTFEQAVIDRLIRSVGIDARTARIAMLKADNLDPAITAVGQYWSDVGRNKRIYSSHHICEETSEAYRRSLLEFKPDILFCYPSSVAALLHFLGDSHGVRIPLVFTSSEVLYPSTFETIRNQLQCDNIDFYGHAERLVTAYNVNGSPYRFLPSYGHAELVPAGDGLARVVGTTLRSAGQLLVRYDTCDLARVPSNDPGVLKQISLGLQTFDGIAGRDSEYVDLPDGRRILMINMIARGADGAESLQFRHDGNYMLDIYIVPGAGFGQATLERILDNFQGKFPNEMQVNLWKVPTRVREPNGKAPLLLSNPCLPAGIVQIELPPAYQQNLNSRSPAAA